LDGEAFEIYQRNLGIILKFIGSKESVRLGLGYNWLRIASCGRFDIRDVD